MICDMCKLPIRAGEITITGSGIRHYPSCKGAVVTAAKLQLSGELVELGQSGSLLGQAQAELTNDKTTQDEREKRLWEIQEREKHCYCVCHSMASSRPSCVHCHPELFADKRDNYCRMTADEVWLAKQLAQVREERDELEKEVQREIVAYDELATRCEAAEAACEKMGKALTEAQNSEAAAESQLSAALAENERHWKDYVTNGRITHNSLCSWWEDNKKCSCGLLKHAAEQSRGPKEAEQEREPAAPSADKPKKEGIYIDVDD